MEHWKLSHIGIFTDKDFLLVIVDVLYSRNA